MERIVVGVDGSAPSQRALDWAIAEARLRGAHLVVVHAWHLPAAAATLYTPTLEPELFAKAATDTLRDTLAQTDTSGLVDEPEHHVVEGGAALAVLEAAKEADLVVVGSRGLGGFGGLLLGSVSHQVVHHATCPVVVVPAG